MSDTPNGMMLAGCGAHRDDPSASCYKIRRLDGTALSTAEVWAELTAAQAEIAELRATIKENIATIKTLSEQVGAASELRAKCDRLEEVLHDGYAVFKCLTPHEQKYTSAENVSAALDAFKRALKSANPGGAHE